MTTISFYARGDISTANNAELNVESLAIQPTVLITFNSGATGDIILEHNGGNPDPDTTVTIDGNTYDFTVELTGDLPVNPKVPTALEGKTITVISVVIDGNTERFFFVNDGSGTLSLMDQIGNGAIPLDNADLSPPPVYICFCRDSLILTPSGYREIQSLRADDVVLTDTGEAKPILWVGRTLVSVGEMLREPNRRPIRIPAGAFGPGLPFADLCLSAQHRVVLEGPAIELLFAEPQVLIRAKHLLGAITKTTRPTAAAEYYHLLLESHAMVVSNGVVTESYQPSARAYAGMSRDARRSLSALVPEPLLQEFFGRRDAMPTLKEHEAHVLLPYLLDGRCASARGAKLAGPPLKSAA